MRSLILSSTFSLNLNVESTCTPYSDERRRRRFELEVNAKIQLISRVRTIGILLMVLIFLLHNAEFAQHVGLQLHAEETLNTLPYSWIPAFLRFMGVARPEL